MKNPKFTSRPLLRHPEPLCTGTIVDRPNRFVLRVDFEGALERVFLGDPGALEGIIERGRSVLCHPVDDPNRTTDYDAVAVDCDGCYVGLNAALANDLFERILERRVIERFTGYRSYVREPPLPDHGRTDFRMEMNDGTTHYVEVKSCTHVDDGVAMFPDRQTERGRRHLRSLRSLATDGYSCSLVFVVQRPDVRAFRPYREVDPEFSRLLARVRGEGVAVRAIATAFDPPAYYLHDPDLPIDV